MLPENKPFARTLSHAAHELVTPFTVVQGYMKMLLKGQMGDLTEKQELALKEMEKSATRLSAVITDMRALAKLEGDAIAITRQPIDVSAVVKDVADNMQEGRERGVYLELRGFDHPFTIVGDRRRLAEAFEAVIASAIRERYPDGPVIVAGTQVAGDDTRPYWLLAVGEEVKLAAVTGAAAGSPPPFDEWKGGMGLRLGLARRVIEAHGGAIWSSPDWSPPAHASATSALRLPLGA